ncbi:MAG: glutamyl-tRNA reductase, partial [Gammaproteobacteria bacterium]|nr:glutamyl-tRNA reductase [Gammaproteobacteria bacterium]
MKILALGLNHETASVELREQAAFSPEALQPALRDLTGGGGVSEAAILSTCNRTEIYCGSDSGRDQRVLNWFRRHTGFSRDILAGNLYALPNEQAVKHAFRVASGLDSMVLGEPQILGQMKHAFHTAATAGATGKVLNRLFQHTFSVAKQVRTHTAIGAHSVSVAYAGVSLARRVFTRLSEQTALLIGAGETIELVARHLAENGIANLIVANRSIDKAQTLARTVGCDAITLGQIPAHLARADIVVSSTASTLPILGKGAVERALAARRHKPMFILDLAVPRDVEAEVSRLRDVYLYTVDDLKSVVERHRGLRRDAAVEAEAIIDLQVVRFMRGMRSLDSVPVIRQLRRELDAT